MDTDVKISFDRLMMACERMSYAKLQEKQHQNLKSLLIADVFDFISLISISGANKRMELFNEMYLSGKASVPNKKSDNSIPKSLVYFCEIDDTILKNQDIKMSGLMASFMAELGRHYRLSKYDKKEIDAELLKKYLQNLNQYISAHISIPEKTVGSALDEAKSEGKSAKANGAAENPSSERASEKESPFEENLDELLDQLNGLTGLYGVKKEVHTLINTLKIKKIRDERGLKAPNVSKHLVFLGNPGTGKTTVARLISKIYKQLGALERGQLIEVDRGDLVAGYVGQTAILTKKKIDEAMGGTLFIDEAYTLAKGGADFGQEAIDTILKAMEDHRENFVVIAAGYSDPMETFLDSNPGLKSRFNKSILFEDYNREELLSIFKSFCEPYEIYLSEEAEQYLERYLAQLCSNKPENFANGRTMRNLFEKAYENQSNRLAELSEITDEALNEITLVDLSMAVKMPDI